MVSKLKIEFDIKDEQEEEELMITLKDYKFKILK